MMRKILCASVLVLVMCVSASAGEIMNPPVAAPPDVDNSPGVTRPSGDQPAEGMDGTEATDMSADAVTAAALTVLDTLLTLL